MKEGDVMKNRKTFITVIAQQGTKGGKSELRKVKYDSPENSKLDYDMEIRFPITAAINGYADSEDRVRVIAIRNIENVNIMYNYETYFLPEMELVRKEKGIPEENFVIETIDVHSFVGMNSDMELFEQLLSCIEMNEEVHICITYGIKSLPIILFAFAEYVVQVKKADIVCIIYGNMYIENDVVIQKDIHDMTGLFYSNRLMIKLAGLGETDPVSKLKELR